MRKYNVTLNVSSIDNLINELTSYKESLPTKTQRFVELLLEKGISMAEQVKGIDGTYGTHKMENFVTFTKKLNVDEAGCHGVMLGMSKSIHARWFGPDGNTRDGELSPIAALEFGTAGAALPVHEAFGVTSGQGTNSQYGHENDFDWYFIKRFRKDSDGNLIPIYKHATAITPSRPMMNAANEMLREIVSTAREVFSE